MPKSRARWFVLFVAYASFCSPAHAYLDPATGSIIVQAIIGVIATWWMYSRMYVHKAKKFIAGFLKRRDADNPK